MKKKRSPNYPVLIPLIIVIKTVILICLALMGERPAGGLPESAGVDVTILKFIIWAVLELLLFFAVWPMFKNDFPPKDQ